MFVNSVLVQFIGSLHFFSTFETVQLGSRGARMATSSSTILVATTTRHSYVEELCRNRVEIG